jgi:hypothetical protein
VRHLLHSVDDYVRGDDDAGARERRPAHIPYRVPASPRKAEKRVPDEAPVALPPTYADLERFAATWALPTFAERRARRDASSIGELRELYAALQPRVEAILADLDRVPLAGLSPGERRLLNLCLALADVALSIEKYDAPGPPNAPDMHFELDTSALD